DAGLLQGFGIVRRPMRDLELLRDLPGRIGRAPRQRDHLDARDILDPLQMLLAESALSRHYDFHDRSSRSDVMRVGGPASGVPTASARLPTADISVLRE